MNKLLLMSLYGVKIMRDLVKYAKLAQQLAFALERGAEPFRDADRAGVLGVDLRDQRAHAERLVGPATNGERRLGGIALTLMTVCQRRRVAVRIRVLASRMRAGACHLKGGAARD